MIVDVETLITPSEIDLVEVSLIFAHVPPLDHRSFMFFGFHCEYEILKLADLLEHFSF